MKNIFEYFWPKAAQVPMPNPEPVEEPFVPASEANPFAKNGAVWLHYSDDDYTKAKKLAHYLCQGGSRCSISYSDLLIEIYEIFLGYQKLSPPTTHTNPPSSDTQQGQTE